MNVASLTLKIIVCVHFILSVWGSMGGFMPQSYVYVHIGVLLCGLWAIGAPHSIDAVVMMMVILGFSILEDIILLALYEPRGYNRYETEHVSESAVNEYRFALGMCILNLILKPISGFLLYRVFVSRNNQAEFSIPGINRIPGLGGMTRSGYEDMDSSNRSSAPYSGVPVETASHHVTVTKE